jgi:hypothetical protein
MEAKMIIKPDIDIEVFCDNCGNELDAYWDSRRERILVSLCKRCEREAYDAGYNEGLES